MHWAGKYSSLACLAAAVFICVESLRLPVGSWQNPGAGFLPLGSGMILAVLSLVDYLQSFKEKPGGRESGPARMLKRVFLVLLALLAYAVFLETLGFLISTFFLLLVLFRSAEPRRWTVSAGASAAASLGAYALFELVLKAQLPRGWFGF